MAEDLKERQRVLEDNINELTRIAQNLDKIIAVHEERFKNQADKNLESKKKAEYLQKTIDDVDSDIIHLKDSMNKRFRWVERYIFMGVGGVAAISVLTSFLKLGS